MSDPRPLHVTHFISCPASGGAEVYVKDLSIAAVKSGLRVSVIFLDRAEEAGRDERYQRDFLRQLDDAGVRYDFLGIRARRNPIVGWRETRRILKELETDIVHAHLSYGVLYTVNCGLPVIYTHHNVVLRMPKIIYRFVFNRLVSSYVGISTICAQVLREAGCRPVIQINNGVDSSRLRVRQQEAAGGQGDDDSKPIIFLAVGRLVRQKNYSRMLYAMAQLPNDMPWRLQIAGEGGERAALDALVRKLDLADRVEFLGSVSDINEYFSSADVFAMSSDWEGLPIALIEATLSGLPVVVTNVGGCAEVVHTACNGVVVDELSVASLSSAFLRMIEDAELRAFFARNALLYGGRYELSNALRQHVDLYFDVVGSQAASPSPT